MRKRLGILSAIALSFGLVTPVLAGQPANHGCLGESVSAAAQLGQLGQLVVAPTAQDDRGVGAEVQLIMAGEFPDEGFPNTYND